MDRKNFYYRQVVGEVELDASFTDVENALKKLALDQELTGIITGFVPSAPDTSPYEVTLSAGVAYSKTLGRGMTYAGGVVSLATDEASNPVTLPSVDGQMRIVSLFIEPTYIESDPRIDGYLNPLNFVKTEAATINVVASAFGTIVTPPVAPVLRSDQVLLADVITYQDSAILYIFTVTATPITATTTFGDLTVAPRSEYMLGHFHEDYIGDTLVLAGSIKDAFATLAAKNKKYQTSNTLSSIAATNPRDVADVNSPDSHDAFSTGGTFEGKPGSYHLKVVEGVSTYVPTVDIGFSPDQEVSGAGPIPHVIDLDTNSVNINLVSDGSFKIKNLTLFAPFTQYRVEENVLPSFTKFENVNFDPVNNPAITHDKLLWNVENTTSQKFRKNYSLQLKNVNSGSGNFIFGARKDILGVPLTQVNGLDSGNLTIDSQGGYYSNIRLAGTDTTTPVLNITGDNNIIENVVIASPAGNAPMISISGNNNIIRNVYLHEFGEHTTPVSIARPAFQAIVFTASSKNNSVEAVHIQGGQNPFEGIETDLNGASWSRTNITSVTDNLVDVANQPLADRVNFTGAGSLLARTDSFGESEAVFEIWAKSDSGPQTFRMNSAIGTATADFTVTSEWQRFRNIATGINSVTNIRNGTDNAARNIIFANPARYNLVNLNNLKLVDFSGQGNKISGILVENLKNIYGPLFYFREGVNKLENALVDGLYSVNVSLLSTEANSFAVAYVDGFSVKNIHTAVMSDYLVKSGNDTSLHLKNIKLDIEDPANLCTNIDCGLLLLDPGDTTVNYSVEDSIFIDNLPSSTGQVPVAIVTTLAPTRLRNVYVKTQYGDGADVNAGGAAFIGYLAQRMSIDNCTFHAERGRSAVIIGASGTISNTVFSGGNTDPGNGIQLFKRLSSGLASEPILKIQDCLLQCGTSNGQSGAAAGLPVVSIEANALQVDGLKIVLSSDTTEGLIDITHDSIYSSGSIKNVDIIFDGYISGTVIQAESTGTARLKLKNIAINGWRIGNSPLNTTLTNFINVLVDDLTIEGYSSPGTSTIAKIITLSGGAKVTNLSLFPNYAIPCLTTLVGLTAPSTVDKFVINYSLTSFPVDYIIDSSVGDNRIVNGAIITEHAAIDIAAVRIGSTVGGVGTLLDSTVIQYVSSLGGAAITKFMVSINGTFTPWHITNNHFTFSTTVNTSPVSINNFGIFDNNTLVNVVVGNLATLIYTPPSGGSVVNYLA